MGQTNMTAGPVCPKCNCPATLVDATYVYGDRANNPDRKMWVCLICGAYVSCHKTGAVPMGTPADKATRDARRKAHKAFDSLWKCGTMTRWEAYLWLAEQMGLPQDKAHIGMFNAAQCETVVDLCKTMWKSG